MIDDWLITNTAIDPYTLTVACLAMAGGMLVALGLDALERRLRLWQRLSYLAALLAGLGLFFLAVKA